MPRYVERDSSGNIVASYAELQPGRAIESLESNSPELREFENPPPELDSKIIENKAKMDPAFRGLVRALSARFGISPAVLLAEIRTEADKV